MKKIYSTNPATGLVYKEFDALSEQQISQKLDLAWSEFHTWKSSSFDQRKKLFLKIAKNLRKNKDTYAKVITLEMGKRIAEAVAEVEKCAWLCEYYAENAQNMLNDISIKTEAQNSYITHQPLGIILAIMPWNFPFWQVFRCAVPAIMAGNTVVLKHASNVPESALLIEHIFKDSGASDGIFQTLLITSASAARVIEDPRIKMISLTGSEEAGMAVASLAGKNIKKTVMELGGSDPFIVLADADVELAAETAATSRMIVSGQSCIAAKRFIVHHSIEKKFTALLKKHFESKKVGDPLDHTTGVCPLSSKESVDSIDDQVQRSIAEGANLITGGKKVDRPGFYYLPTILGNVKPTMAVAVEETFGPVAAVLSFETDQEALEIANNSRFGLGACVWTRDQEKAQFFAEKLEAGGVFVNSMVKSDPRMPFGGTKFSGYGRELSEYGIKEFVIIKSVWVEGLPDITQK